MFPQMFPQMFPPKIPKCSPPTPPPNSPLSVARVRRTPSRRHRPRSALARRRQRRRCGGGAPHPQWRHTPRAVGSECSPSHSRAAAHRSLWRSGRRARVARSVARGSRRGVRTIHARESGHGWSSRCSAIRAVPRETQNLLSLQPRSIQCRCAG